MQSLSLLDFTLAPVVVNGIFTLPKKEKLRLIIDARPANALFADPPNPHLPTPDLFARLQIPDDATVFVAKSDLSDYYHTLLLPSWLRPYLALPAVRAGDVGLASVYGDRWVFPMCVSVPMGWSWAVYLAQRAHVNLILRATSLEPDRFIDSNARLIVDRLLWTVYIDDLIILDIVRSRADAALQECGVAYRWVGLSRNEAKTLRASESDRHVLGFLFDGVQGLLSLPPEKMDRLIATTTALLRVGRCSGNQLRTLLGFWTWVLLLRRPAFAVLSSVYRFVAVVGDAVHEIWPSVRSELELLVGLAPLLFADLRTPFSERIVATDASEFGCGVVSSRAALPTVERMVSSLPSHPSPSLSFRSDVSTIFSSLSSALSWSTIVSCAWASPAHINALELSSVSVALRWLLSLSDSSCKRFLLLVDSSVTAGVLCKGRSSSRSLLPAARRIAALCLASGIALFPRWIPTAVNPADVASRDIG
jgi:hypothetical protein